MKKNLSNLAILFTTIILFFLIFELIFFGIEMYKKTQEKDCSDSFVKDSVFHHIHKPYENCIKNNFYNEFNINVEFNNKGFYDINHNESKSEKKTVLLLGDSFYEAMYLKKNETLVQVLNKTLKDITNESFRVINLGISSYSAITQYTSYKALGYKYDPDYVILGWVINDPAGDFNLIQEITVDDDSWVYEEQKKPLINKIRAFVGKLKTTQLIYNSLQRLKGSSAKLGEGDFNFGPSISGEPCHNIYWYFNNLTYDENKRCWNANLLYILKTKIAVEKDGHKFILMPIPFPLQVSRHEWQSGKEAWGFENDYFINNTKPQDILKEFSEKSKIQFVNPLPNFVKESTESNRLFFDFDGHWNYNGVKVYAKEIANVISKNSTNEK